MISLHSFFLWMAHASVFFLIPCDFLLKTVYLNFIMIELWKSVFSPNPRACGSFSCWHCHYSLAYLCARDLPKVKATRFLSYFLSLGTRSALLNISSFLNVQQNNRPTGAAPLNFLEVISWELKQWHPALLHTGQ